MVLAAVGEVVIVIALVDSGVRLDGDNGDDDIVAIDVDGNMLVAVDSDMKKN